MAKERERDRDSGHNSINSEIKRTGEDRDRQQNRVIQRTLKIKKKNCMKGNRKGNYHLY